MYRYHVFYLIIIITSIFIKKISSIPGIKMFLEQFSTYVILKIYFAKFYIHQFFYKIIPYSIQSNLFRGPDGRRRFNSNKNTRRGANSLLSNFIHYFTGTRTATVWTGDYFGWIDGNATVPISDSRIYSLALSWFSIAFFDDEFLIIRYFFFFFFHIINILMTY